MTQNCNRAIGMITASMSARDVAQRFNRHGSTIRRKRNIFQQAGNVADGTQLKPLSRRPFYYDVHSTNTSYVECLSVHINCWANVLKLSGFMFNRWNLMWCIFHTSHMFSTQVVWSVRSHSYFVIRIVFCSYQIVYLFEYMENCSNFVCCFWKCQNAIFEQGWYFLGILFF